MPVKDYSTKLEERQIRQLRELSKQTHIPQAVLVRQAVDLLLEKKQEELELLNFVKMIDEQMDEDQEAMQELAKF